VTYTFDTEQGLIIVNVALSGLLGLDFFRITRLTLDFSNGEIDLS